MHAQPIPILRYRAARAGAFGLALAALAAAAATAASAQTPLRRADSTSAGDARPLVVAVSGGSSLGAYQAGASWALLELFRAARSEPELARELGLPPLRPAAVAGASAGNINALLWAVEACADRPPRPPESSLFWRIWTPVGLRQLLREDVPAQKRDRALFDRSFFRDSLHAQVLDELRGPELVPGCRVTVGSTLTRMRPDTLQLGDLEIVTQRFATAYVARVKEASPPELRFRWPPDRTIADPRLGRFVLPPRRGDDADIDPADILAVVEASSALPLAFQPVRLSLVDPQSGAAEPALFLDGGVFDNSPAGLALDLLLGADGYADRLEDAEPDTVLLLFVEARRLRGDLARVRAAAVRPPPAGGMLSVVRMLEGALPTARQYELQLWARDTRIRAPDTLQVRVTSRAHPLFGEHMGLFAAFLARPFREYDFFVGVYDALDFVAREFACDRATGGETCVARTVARLLERPAIDFGLAAPPLLAALHAREHGQPADQVTSLENTARGAGVGGDPVRAALLLGMLRAQEGQYATDQHSRCGTPALPQLILCQRGFREVLLALGESPETRAAVDAWRDGCAAVRGREHGECLEARDFAALVRNPDRYAARAIDQLLRRLRESEHQLHLDRVAAGGEHVAHGPDPEVVSELLMALYRGRPARPRYGFSWSPSSAPPEAWLAHTLLPYHVAANLGARGVEAGIRPTWHLDPRVALIFPATVHVARTGTANGEEATEPRRLRTHAGGGAGLAFTGVLPPAAGLLIVPEFGLSAQALAPPSGWPREAVLVAEAYLDVSLLLGRLRLALRRASDPALFGGDRWTLAGGLSDLNGMLYWARRLVLPD